MLRKECVVCYFAASHKFRKETSHIVISFSICKQPSAGYRKMNKFHLNGSIFLGNDSFMDDIAYFLFCRIQSDVLKRRQKQIITIKYVSIEISLFWFFPPHRTFCGQLFYRHFCTMSGAWLAALNKLTTLLNLVSHIWFSPTLRETGIRIGDNNKRHSFQIDVNE